MHPVLFPHTFYRIGFEFDVSSSPQHEADKYTVCVFNEFEVVHWAINKTKVEEGRKNNMSISSGTFRFSGGGFG